jgi:hypothetical protein
MTDFIADQHRDRLKRTKQSVLIVAAPACQQTAITPSDPPTKYRVDAHIGADCRSAKGMTAQIKITAATDSTGANMNGINPRIGTMISLVSSY